MRIGAQIHFSSHDGGFELRGAVAAVAETFESTIEIRQEVNVDTRVGGNFLA